MALTITRTDIARRIADECGFSKSEAMEVLEKLLEIMKKRLIAGEAVMISGFGRWNVKSKNARRGRNPQTGDELVIDARRIVTWSHSPVLKAAVNGSDGGSKKWSPFSPQL
jgi:integration host factor subunit alpha